MKKILLGCLLAIFPMVSFAADDACLVIAEPDTWVAPVNVIYSCPGSAPNMAAQVDFGDGSRVNNAAKPDAPCTPERGCGQMTSVIQGQHIYKAAGQYRISITSADGSTQTIDLTVK